MGRIADGIRKALFQTQTEAERRRLELFAKAREARCAWAWNIETLFKLRSLDSEARGYTLDIIENARLYFPSPEQFNDPFDCAPPFQLAGNMNDPSFVEELVREETQMALEGGLTPEALAKMRTSEGVPIEQMAAAARKHTLEALRRGTRILCLSAEQRHPLMWSHYASGHTGISLHFRCGPDNVFGLARSVTYHRDRKPVLLPLNRQTTDEIVERLAFEKAEFWEYEHEYRITDGGPEWEYKFDGSNRISFPPELLCGITLGMRISEHDKRELLAIAAARKPSLPPTVRHR